jgi:hypothetical protein
VSEIIRPGEVYWAPLGSDPGDRSQWQRIGTLADGDLGYAPDLCEACDGTGDGNDGPGSRCPACLGTGRAR